MLATCPLNRSGTYPKSIVNMHMQPVRAHLLKWHWSKSIATRIIQQWPKSPKPTSAIKCSLKNNQRFQGKCPRVSVLRIHAAVVVTVDFSISHSLNLGKSQSWHCQKHIVQELDFPPEVNFAFNVWQLFVVVFKKKIISLKFKCVSGVCLPSNPSLTSNGTTADSACEKAKCLNSVFA